jgi:hypothetical protein
MSGQARLVRLDGAGAEVHLDPARPLTIGRDPACGLCLPGEQGLSRRHAELRPDPAGGWLLCDLGSSNGTFLEGERLEGCRRLRPGDQLRLGRRGPLLQYVVAGGVAVAEAAGIAPRALAFTPGAAAPLAAASPGLAGAVAVAGRQLPLEQIRTVELRSEARHPQTFSWWVLACLGGLLLLPFPWLFWPWQAAGLALAILLSRRQEHTLIVTLRDGQAHRHRFADRPTALAHRNGLRRSLGQSLEP